MRRWIWRLWAALSLVLLLAWFAAPIRRVTDAVAWIQKAPLLGLYALWPLWQGARLLLSRMRHAPLAPWQGRYFEFEGTQIRILVGDDERLLFVVKDVLLALRITGRDRHIDRIRAAAGREGVRTVEGSGETVFTEKGLQAWLERNSRREVARFEFWLRTQVSDPYRRSLERGSRHWDDVAPRGD